LLTGQAVEQAQNLDEMFEATTSAEFFRRAVATVVHDNSPEARMCTVCLEEGLPLTNLAITPCAHTFCLECIRVTVSKFASCSICRHPLSEKNIRPLEEELGSAGAGNAASRADEGNFEMNAQHADPIAHAASASSSSSAAPLARCQSASSSSEGQTVAEPVDPVPHTINFNKYGTKLEALVRKLQELRQEDATAKVILFVQFDDLKRKVASALIEFGVPTLQLQGSVAQRSGVVRDWQNNPASSAFVLLLSLAQSASGSNLTAANHVVFLHPMLAPTPERAVGYEMQAVGRARRHGQKRDVVHVWRFVTAGTVEQTITERHQNALWERERAQSATDVTPNIPSDDENVQLIDDTSSCKR